MYIHLMPDDTFVDEFIGFSTQIPGYNNHYWVDSTEASPKIVKKHTRVVNLSHPTEELLKELENTEKIFIHGMTTNTINIFSNPRFKGKKIYWVIWGSDLYQWLNFNLYTQFDFIKSSRFKFPLNIAHYFYSSFRRRYDVFVKAKHAFTKMLDNLSGLMHYNEFDVEMLNRQYKKQIPHYHYFYKNLIDWKELDHALATKKHVTDPADIKVLLGNSATPTNNHFSILRKFGSPKLSNFSLYVILSYGDKQYGEAVGVYGEKVLGKRFHPIKNYMSGAQYTDLLLSMDLGIMNHSRSQGMGNIIVLLYLGKLVYLNPISTTYKFLLKHGFHVFSTGELDKAADQKISGTELEHNKQAIKNFFSDDNFFENLRRIYASKQ